MLDLCQPLWSTYLIEEQLWFSEHDRDVDLWCCIIVACQPPCNQRFLSEFAQQWSSQGGWILNCLQNIQIQQKRDFPLLGVDFISTLHSTGSHHQFPRKSGFLSNVAIQLRLNGTFCCALIFEEVNISFSRLSRSVKIEFLNCQDYVGLPTPSRNLNKSESCELCNTFHSPASFALTLWRTSEESLIHGIVFVHSCAVSCPTI